MSKSIKLKDNNYWDSRSVIHKGKTMYSILEDIKKDISFNSEYVYYEDLSFSCIKIGRIVILNIYTLGFKKAMDNYVVFASGLPKPTVYTVFYMYGGNGACGTTARIAITGEGTLQTHWGAPPHYGESANKQYSCTLVYEAVE